MINLNFRHFPFLVIVCILSISCDLGSPETKRPQNKNDQGKYSTADTSINNSGNSNVSDERTNSECIYCSSHNCFNYCIPNEKKCATCKDKENQNYQNHPRVEQDISNTNDNIKYDNPLDKDIFSTDNKSKFYSDSNLNCKDCFSEFHHQYPYNYNNDSKFNYNHKFNYKSGRSYYYSYNNTSDYHKFYKDFYKNYYKSNYSNKSQPNYKVNDKPQQPQQPEYKKEFLCISCKTELVYYENDSCNSCKANKEETDKIKVLIQDSIEIFGLKGMNPDDITHEYIKKKYRKIAMKIHPDKFGNASQEEKDHAKTETQRLNATYDFLKTDNNLDKIRASLKG